MSLFHKRKSKVLKTTKKKEILPVSIMVIQVYNDGKRCKKGHKTDTKGDSNRNHHLYKY